jgi:secreted PhoX family phosphatase
VNRRSLLESLGLTALGAAIGVIGDRHAEARSTLLREWPSIQGPIPLPSDGLSAAQQRQAYQRINLLDRLEVPKGFRSDVLLSWGDRLGNGVMGFNNDYLAFTPLAPDRALLTINFEYISALTWWEGYSEAHGRSLPFAALEALLQQAGGEADIPALPATDPLRTMAEQIAQAALEDLGIGVASLRREADGRWRHEPTTLERRIHGLTGLKEPRQRLRSSGPAAAVFRKPERQGYNDGLGDRIIGTFANCAGGQTPWGTVLSAEENFQTQVMEAVYADGSSPAPSQRRFQFTRKRVAGLGNPFGLAGNKYGWMVEIDPRDPGKPAVKHTWLGRFRHEAVAVRAKAGEPLVVYSGCDRHSGHLYRFVSRETVRDPRDPGSSRLLEKGRLEVAQLQPDGTGRWLLLAPQTPIAPFHSPQEEMLGSPSRVEVPHSDRNRAGGEVLRSLAERERYRSLYPTLADLYRGDAEEQQGAILIDAHLAANAIGATPTARPEDTDMDPISGDLLITFTMGGSDETGNPDPGIFRGPRGETPWPFGWLMRLSDTPADTDTPGGALQWRMAATGGTPWDGGLGFANPDNLAIDQRGNLWIVTDRSFSSSESDIFGKNACWLLPRNAATGQEAVLFANGPLESELCGPCFDADEHTLFLAVQHPGEQHGCHQREQIEMQAFSLEDRSGQRFEQLRSVPLGSNWPSGVPGRPPRSSIVAIRRSEGGPLLPSG